MRTCGRMTLCKRTGPGIAQIRLNFRSSDGHVPLAFVNTHSNLSSDCTINNVQLWFKNKPSLGNVQYDEKLDRN